MIRSATVHELTAAIKSGALTAGSWLIPNGAFLVPKVRGA